MNSLRTFALFLATIGLPLAPAGAQTVFFDDFESGALNWTASGPWHLLDTSTACGTALGPFPSGSKCLWFGVETAGGACNFNVPGPVPNSGPLGSIAMTMPVQLSGSGRFAWLRYANRVDSEGCNELHGAHFDVSERFVSIDGGASWIPLEADCKGTPWHKGRADLTPYLGEQVLVRFHFFALDETANEGFGWLVDDVELRIEPGRPACDASPACPCGNYTPPVERSFEAPETVNIGGCLNSLQQNGELWATGIANMSQDTVVLHADGMPPGTTALFFQGSASSAPAPIADGTSCVSGTLLRLGLKTTMTGAVVHPSPGDLPLSATAVAHESRIYQVYYRNANPTYCTPATFNMTNSYGVSWGP